MKNKRKDPKSDLKHLEIKSSLAASEYLTGTSESRNFSAPRICTNFVIATICRGSHANIYLMTCYFLI